MRSSGSRQAPAARAPRADTIEAGGARPASPRRRRERAARGAMAGEERSALLVDDGGDGDGDGDEEAGGRARSSSWSVDRRPAPGGDGDGEEDADAERRARRAVSLRILPLFFLAALFCYIDRTNMAFAADGLQSDLGLSDTAYGLGASVFFITYATCGIPGTLLAKRVGVKYGLATMLVLWGGVSAMMAAVRDLAGLVSLRLLMGAAEAATFPTMLLHLSTFFGPESLGTVYTSTCCAATALSGVIGGPLAALILSAFSGVGGMASWRWLFFIGTDRRRARGPPRARGERGPDDASPRARPRPPRQRACRRSPSASRCSRCCPTRPSPAPPSSGRASTAA